MKLRSSVPLSRKGEGTGVRRARLFAVAIPLREPFVISGGTMAVRRSLIVELTDSQGNRGYGESAPFEQPFYSSETFSSARACLVELLLPAIVGMDAARPETCRDRLADIARGNRMAKAGVETAWWDLCAARNGATLASLIDHRLEELGVEPRWRSRAERIECGVALGIPPGGDPMVLRERVRDALARGYRRIKLKVRPGWDEEPVRVAREEMEKAARSLPLWVDANGAYRLERDRLALEALDRLGLLFIEQPLPEGDLWDSCVLGRSMQTPICFDETLVSDDLARQILGMNGPRIWNLKIQRVGGLEEACRIYARAAGAGVALWGGTMPETGLGAQAILALGSHAAFVYPSDVEPSTRWYQPGADLVELEMAEDGTMLVPQRRPSIDLGGKGVLVAEIGA
ncbi:MAG: hypothetical protein HY700_03670 [Gemmatimonadetes bacterium]|nr:hypothetical protein [Gemmatimonadota bacterium]